MTTNPARRLTPATNNPITWNPTYRQRYGFGGFPDLITRSDCRMCKGTGHAGGNADDPNECGFCTEI